MALKPLDEIKQEEQFAKGQDAKIQRTTLPQTLMDLAPKATNNRASILYVYYLIILEKKIGG